MSDKKSLAPWGGVWNIAADGAITPVAEWADMAAAEAWMAAKLAWPAGSVRRAAVEFEEG